MQVVLVVRDYYRENYGKRFAHAEKSNFESEREETYYKSLVGQVSELSESLAEVLIIKVWFTIHVNH